MEFRDVVRRRRMVRRYSDRRVDPAVVTRAIEHATRAPSAGFSQGWGFLVLEEPADVRRFWEATSDDVDDPGPWLAGMMTAPVVIVPCSSKAAYLARYAEPDKGWEDRAEARWAKPYWHMDAAMASLLILQTAVDEGLGACFFGVPPGREDALREAFGLPDDVDPVGVVTLGHRDTDTGSAGSPARRGRRPLEEVLHRGRWGAGGGTAADGDPGDPGGHHRAAADEAE